ncbi:rhomboid family intramembrane serine protease [soil metagenome]
MTAPANVRTCYRHPDRVAGIVCQRCDRPICPSCMHQASVGFHCPECTKQRAQKVYQGVASLATKPLATQVLIGLNVVIFIGTAITRTTVGWTTGGKLLARSGYGGLTADGSLVGFLVPDEPWRLVTSGFLHDGIFHLGLNMWALWILGRILEQALGRGRFLALYFTSLMGGSLGVMLLDGRSVTVGASGALFGMLAALILVARDNKMDLMRSGLLPILGLNLLITFAIPGISIGGHIGGLVAGGVAGLAFIEGTKRLGPRASPLTMAAVSVLGVGLALAAYLLAVSEFGFLSG